ncbi:hypothetical protein FACS189483_00880 [Spirochaetia bacterium]|nr:hypothetical protein FACS189483_00880 [Spirochaetia bacterium]
MKKNTILLLVSLGLMFFGSLFAGLVQSGFGTIKVRDVQIYTDGGAILGGTLLVPKGVSAENPAPGIVTIHGYLNSRGMQTSFSTEFARRGYVVLNIDMFGHGTSGTENPDTDASVPAVRYLNSLAFVDSNNIGVEGHSKGGFSATLGALRLPPGSVKSVLAIGSGLTWLAYTGLEFPVDMPVNYGTIYGSYDDFGWLMWSEAHTDHKNVPHYANYSPQMVTAFGVAESVEPFTWYGSKAANTQRIFYQVPEIHTKNHISNLSAGYAMNFMNATLSGGNKAGLADSNMIWYWKEILTTISMLAMFVFLFALGNWLLSVGQNSAYTSVPAPGKAAFNIRFWIMLVIGAALPALTYFSFMNAGEKILKLSRLFPQPTSSAVGFWAFINGLLTLALLIIVYRIFGKKEGVQVSEWGFKAPAKNILRQVLLGFATVFGAYLLLCAANFFFHVDFRSFVIGFMPLTLSKFQALCAYFVFFAVFALCNALALNASYRFTDGSFLKTAIFSILANVCGMVVLIIIGYGGMRILGYLPFKSTGWSLRIIQAMSFLVFLPLAALLNTWFYKKTGSIYMGATITALILAFATVGNTAMDFLF